MQDFLKSYSINNCIQYTDGQKMTPKMSYIILFLPTLVAAKISINITCQFHTDNSSVDFKFSGWDENIIAEKERIPFGITDDKLKDCLNKYMGKRPDDVYLHSPTPWHDLYSAYNWKEVVRTVTPKSGRVLNITAEPHVVLQQYFGNKSQKPANYSIQLSTTVENRVFSSWKKSEELVVNGDFKYEINISELRNIVSFSFNSSWENDNEHIEAVTIGSMSPWKVLLDPGQVAKAVLTANRGVINMEIEYEASINGAVAVNYNPPFNGHHFWGPSVSHVMEACEISNSLVYKEILSMDLYASPKIQLVDLKSKEKIGEFIF